MRKYLFFSLFLVVVLNSPCLSQTPDWLWLGRGGGTGTYTPSDPSIDDRSNAITIDKKGNTTICGQFFASNSTNINGDLVDKYGNIDGFVASFNCNGELRWKFSFGASNHDYATDIDCDSMGNLYVTGRAGASSSISDKFHFADTAVDFFGNQAFTAKLDTSGKLVWLKIAYMNAPTATTYSDGVAIDYINDKIQVLIKGNGNYDVFEDSVFVLPGYVLAEYSLDGELIKANRIYDNGSKFSLYDISITKNYGTYISGTVADSININGKIFDPRPSSAEALVLRFDTNMNIVWSFMATPPGLTNISNGGKIEATNNAPNSFYLCGQAYENSKFGNLTLTNAFSSVGYLLKVQNGQTEWLRNLKSNSANNSISGIDLDEFEMIYVTGDVKGTAVFAKDTLMSKDIVDPFIAAIDKFGNGIFSKTLPTKGNYGNYPMDIAAGYNENVFITGSFESRIELPNDSIYSQGGNSDIFIAKFGIEECNDTTTKDTADFISELTSNRKNLRAFPNPTTGTFTIDSKTEINALLSLYTSLGMLVWEKQVNGSKNEITIPSYLKSGIYIVKLQFDQEVSTARLILNR